MSEFINNRQEIPNEVKKDRQVKLKSLIRKLHEGIDFNVVKDEFEKEFGKVSAKEISDLEHELMLEGMKAEEIQSLCDVHSAVFKGSIDEIHGITPIRVTPGHPVNTMLRENKELKNFLGFKLPFHMDLFTDNDNENTRDKLFKDLEYLSQIDRHYLRKENLLFPYMESYGIYGPAKVMWGVDDEIRADLKYLKNTLNNLSKEEIIEKLTNLSNRLNEMIFKEEEILLPMAEENLTQDEWFKIQEESHEFGYSFIDRVEEWIPKKVIEDVVIEKKEETIPDGLIRFETGIINVKQLEFMLNALPVDITFIDQDDVVRYFSHGKERIFPRTKSVIGRTVQNCHPPKSVHIVETILENFKSGKKDSEDFWIQMHGMFVYIRYFAVRDENGKYLGTLEFTQNIKPIKELEGEKRLLDE